MHGMEPVFVRRSLRTASGLPQRMSQRGDVRVPENREAVFIHSVPARLLAMLVSVLRVLKSLSGALMPSLAILLLMGLRGAPMRLGGNVVQLGRPLMVFVMRSVVVTSGHRDFPTAEDGPVDEVSLVRRSAAKPRLVPRVPPRVMQSPLGG